MEETIKDCISEKKNGNLLELHFVSQFCNESILDF